MTIPVIRACMPKNESRHTSRVRCTSDYESNEKLASKEGSPLIVLNQVEEKTSRTQRSVADHVLTFAEAKASVPTQVPNWCGIDCVFMLRPYPGSVHYPRRIECLKHGYRELFRSGIESKDKFAQKKYYGCEDGTFSPLIKSPFEVVRDVHECPVGSPAYASTGFFAVSDLLADTKDRVWTVDEEYQRNPRPHSEDWLRRQTQGRDFADKWKWNDEEKPLQEAIYRPTYLWLPVSTNAQFSRVPSLDVLSSVSLLLKRDVSVPSRDIFVWDSTTHSGRLYVWDTTTKSRRLKNEVDPATGVAEVFVRSASVGRLRPDSNRSSTKLKTGRVRQEANPKFFDHKWLVDNPTATLEPVRQYHVPTPPPVAEVRQPLATSPQIRCTACRVISHYRDFTEKKWVVNPDVFVDSVTLLCNRVECKCARGIAAFDQQKADDFAYWQMASAPQGTRIHDMREVREWSFSKKGNSPTDPNLAGANDDVVQSQGKFIEPNTTGAVRWGSAHDSILNEIENPTEPEIEMSVPVRIELAVHHAGVRLRRDRGRREAHALREEYNENVFKTQITINPIDGSIRRLPSENEKRLSLPSREVKPFYSGMTPLRKFRGLDNARLHLIPAVAPKEKLSDFYFSGMKASMKQKWDEEVEEADRLYHEVIDEALESASLDPDYQPWLSLFELAKRGAYRELKRPSGELPGSTEDMWLASVWYWGGNIFAPAKPKNLAEVAFIKRIPTGEHHDIPDVPVRELADDGLLGTPSSEAASSEGNILDRAAEEYYSDSSVMDAYGGHDDENVSFVPQGDDIKDFAWRETREPVNRTAVLETMLIKHAREYITNTDAVYFTVKLRNIPHEHASAILQIDIVNTLDAQFSRNKEKTNKVITGACSHKYCEGACRQIQKIIDELSLEAHADFMSKSGFYLLVKHKNQAYKLEHLDIEKFRDDPMAEDDNDRASLAQIELCDEAVIEAERKARQETNRKAEIKRRIRLNTDAYNKAKIYYHDPEHYAAFVEAL